MLAHFGHAAWFAAEDCSTLEAAARLAVPRLLLLVQAGRVEPGGQTLANRAVRHSLGARLSGP